MAIFGRICSSQITKLLRTTFASEKDTEQQCQKFFDVCQLDLGEKVEQSEVVVQQVCKFPTFQMEIF